MRTLFAVLLLAGSILVGAGCEESSPSSDEAAQGETGSAPPPASTPEDRVREAVATEVAASGFAGDVQIREVFFEGREAQVTATTPEGGFEGPSCEDLDDGAEAIFATIYDEAQWSGGASIVYKGGLVNSSTGEELPDANTGVYTMPAGNAERIDWSNEDVLLNIDWSNYRDFCHQALN